MTDHDPWQTQNNEESAKVNTKSGESSLEFEDNFEPSPNYKSLPDSELYLENLERKLQKIKKGSKLVDALAEKRQDCLRSLLQEDSQVERSVLSVLNNNEIIEFDRPISNGESTVQEIYRHIQPVQPVNLGEVLRIVEFDQLEQQRQEVEEIEKDIVEKPEFNQ